MSANGVRVPSAAAEEGMWRRALGALFVVLVVIIAVYRDTALAMVHIWMRSDTFAHGFVVPPIALWLIWRRRHDLAQIPPRPSVAGLLALALAGFFWLLGELASVAALAQFALVSMLVLAIPAILGFAVARRIAFPLAFLYFAVPFGEFALPWLMEWTAQFTVLGLRLTGIPVYREGLNFVIPSGRWSVVEACSGVRYLIASLTVGTLFAYLTYRSFRRRLLFIAVSFVVPLFANWLRAYMIVLIGHYSGNTLAVGVDHLIYGWVFFGLVIGIMFWIGAHWSEDEATFAEAPQRALGQADAAYSRRAAVAALAIALTALWPLAQARIVGSALPAPGELGPLDAVAGWTLAADPPTSWQPGYANAAATLNAAFSSPPRSVGLYLAYYRNQDGSRKMVSSGNTLLGDGARAVQLAAGGRAATLGGAQITVRTARLRAGDSLELLAWQWYWIDGRVTASDTLAKAYTAWSRLTGRGDDSAVIVVYAPSDPEGGAALAEFAQAAWPRIAELLQQTRSRR